MVARAARNNSTSRGHQPHTTEEQRGDERREESGEKGRNRGRAIRESERHVLTSCSGGGQQRGNYSHSQRHRTFTIGYGGYIVAKSIILPPLRPEIAISLTCRRFSPGVPSS